MSSKAMDLPEIGSEWTHASEPGVFVVNGGTPDGHVIWTEKGDTTKYYAHVREFRSVFQPAGPYAGQVTPR